mgnify:CR=1 FL=1
MAVPLPGDAPEEFAQLTIQQRVIIRVPMMRAPAPPPRPAPPSEDDDWEEHKGPNCLKLKTIVGARIVVQDGIDLIMRDSSRYRAKFERGCPSSGFYSGFYVEPTKDGSICAGRDTLMARNGMECEIDRFRSLSIDK